MMKRKELTKSAPARRTSKAGMEKKNTTMKEITGWISNGESEGDQPVRRSGGRNVSQLTENVTEERMLYSRQLELGRERYKFLSLHEYEKQKFVERQSQKDKRMKRYMESARRVIDKSCTSVKAKSITVHVPQVEYYEQTSTPNDEDNTPRMASPSLSRFSAHSSKSKTTNTDLKNKRSTKNKAHTASGSAMFHNKGIDTKIGKPRVAFDASAEEPLSKGVDKVGGNKKQSRLMPSKSMREPSTNRRFNTSAGGIYVNTSEEKPFDIDHEIERERNRLPLVGESSVFDDRRSKGILMRSQSTSPAKCSLMYLNTVQTQTTAPAPNVVYKSLAPKLNEKRPPPYGERFGTAITDPRYVALQNTLQTCTKDSAARSKVSVKDIIAKNEVLKIRSKCEYAAHAKQMHAKFIALLLQNEFASA
ncbi:uncharacterized protein LOC128221875 [Mya arenaria]|uniref:uncharacterized protein LOC128221875 n=1 Tax=Mya arenaria TaxID=6604 RepID=UPI0022E7B2D1|nr:uncharacterized protein LOC128221875 [Mya arenaria]